MKYQQKSFSVAVGGKKYSEGWERTFGKQPVGYGACPGCGEEHEKTSRERRPNGNTTCGACGQTFKSSEWPR